MTAAIAGFLLSLSLILAIGAQNAFVLRQGLKGQHVGAVVLICILSEVVLIFTGVIGFGALAEALPSAERLIRWAGALFLIAYGFRSLRLALGPPQTLVAADGSGGSLRTAVLTCLALTWLNPHVYLDTVVFLGSVAAQWGPDRFLFGLGAVTASALFFVLLGYGGRVLQPVFATPLAWRLLDGAMALLMWGLAALLFLA